MLGFISTALAYHVIPNIVMKGVKTTKPGHKILTTTFSAGVALGRQGKVINPTVKQFMKYGIGPESMIEYELGLKMGTDLQTLTPTEQEAYINSFKQEVLSNLENFSEEEIKEARQTPYINTIIAFALDEKYTFLERMIEKTSKEKNVSNWAATCMFLATMALLAILEPHILFQPAICFIREKVGKSKFGKKYLRKKFDEGMEGKPTNKLVEILTDVFISPSVLDPKRVGQYIRKRRQ